MAITSPPTTHLTRQERERAWTTEENQISRAPPPTTHPPPTYPPPRPTPAGWTTNHHQTPSRGRCPPPLPICMTILRTHPSHHPHSPSPPRATNYLPAISNINAGNDHYQNPFPVSVGGCSTIPLGAVVGAAAAAVGQLVGRKLGQGLVQALVVVAQEDTHERPPHRPRSQHRSTLVINDEDHSLRRGSGWVWG